MTTQATNRKIALIALGGSGRRTAVTLAETLLMLNNKPSSHFSSEVRVFAVDFWPMQDSGYVVDQSHYFNFLRYGQNIEGAWRQLEELQKLKGFEPEPWMSIGPISEMELLLARDAQQTGIRGVDHQLLIYLENQRLREFLESRINDFLNQDQNSNTERVIMTFGSIAGRTGTYCHAPVQEIVSSFSDKTDFYESILFAPEAFSDVPWIRSVCVQNFIDASRTLLKWKLKSEGSSQAHNQVLVSRNVPLLTQHRENGKENPESEFVNIIADILSNQVLEDLDFQSLQSSLEEFEELPNSHAQDVEYFKRIRRLYFS
jgi:hypothetical protein